MTIEEIFSELAQHMIEGLMIHAQMSDYYGFLGLDGYQTCHNYHYYEESINYRKLIEYYLNHYGKLPLDKPFNNPKVIPDSWHNFKRQDVDLNTRRGAIQAGMEKWVKWETDTKKLYEKAYMEAYNLGEVAAAMEIKCYLLDVDKELAYAENKLLKLVGDDYNISDIIVEQDDLKKKFKKKMQEIKIC